MSCPALRVGNASLVKEERMSTPSSKREVILGMDTHLDIHMGVLISSTGKLLGELPMETNTAGYQKLLKWAQSFGQLN
jgi:hypothetical protein